MGIPVSNAPQAPYSAATWCTKMRAQFTGSMMPASRSQWSVPQRVPTSRDNPASPSPTKSLLIRKWFLPFLSGLVWSTARQRKSERRRWWGRERFKYTCTFPVWSINFPISAQRRIFLLPILAPSSSEFSWTNRRNIAPDLWNFTLLRKQETAVKEEILLRLPPDKDSLSSSIPYPGSISYRAAITKSSTAREKLDQAFSNALHQRTSPGSWRITHIRERPFPHTIYLINFELSSWISTV